MNMVAELIKISKLLISESPSEKKLRNQIEKTKKDLKELDKEGKKQKKHLEKTRKDLEDTEREFNEGK